eukprot:s1409_g8.t1
MADRALAEDLAGEVRRHGGTLQANYLPAVRPDLRKRLGDGKLLQFVALFPDLLEVRPWHGGHLLCSCEGDPSTTQTGKAVGQAPSGATRPGPGQGQLSERAVHALRQLERELIQRLSTRLKSSHTAETAMEGAVDVAWLLHNGKIRRRIGAVVRFHPIPELFVQTAKASETAEDREDDDATPQRGASSSCPLSDHARTYAGYLLQFLRDRHELFQLCPAHGGDRPVCIYGDALCSCRMRVSILPEGWRMLTSLADDEDLEALIQLVAQKVSQLTTACGSQKVPLVRLGRDADVKKALRGRALLSLLDADARRQAAAGHGPRLRLETSSATFLVALQAGAFKLEEAAPTLPTANRNRRMAPPPSICLLGEAPGLAVLRKPPKMTTEALLEALQSQFDQQNAARQVISVSRLDRDTSGVLVAATSTEGADCLTEQFKGSKNQRWAADLQSYERERRVELNPGLFKGPTVGYVRGGISKRERSYNPLLGRFLDEGREQEQAQFEEKVKKNFLNFARDVQLRREAPFDLVTHERKFEAFGPDASAGLEPPVKKKPPFPDTAADYNIISNLPFNEHHWAHPDHRPRPGQRIPKQRMAPAMLHKDFNILTNRYLEHHKEKMDRDRELNLLEAAEKLRQTSAFNPVQQRFGDPRHEERMRACEDALTTEIKLRGEEVQPLIYRGSVTNAYDMLNHQVKDRDLLHLIEGADEERKVRFRTRHQLEENTKKLDVAYDARAMQMKANRVAHERFAPSIHRGFDIVTNQDFGQKGKQIHMSNTRPHQTPWQKVAQEATEGAGQGQSEAHSVFKRYLALCSGRVVDTRGQINAKLYISGFAEKYRAYVSPKGKESVTDFEVLAYLSRPCDAVGSQAPPACDDLGRAVSAYATGKAADKECYTLLACYPRTGRTHQIRAHLEFRGHPLVSDANYNPRGQVRRQFAWCPRLWLHCEKMVFKDLQGAPQTFRPRKL